MNTVVSSPILLRRIARLEASVERLSKALGSLRSALNRRDQRPPTPDSPPPTAAKGSPKPNRGGLAGATARGEAARVQWIKDGLIVSGEQLAQAWGLTRQALAPASERGDVFAVKVGNRLYYPQSFLILERDSVAAICRALGELGASEKLMFWLREHGALGGKNVSAALEAGVSLTKVERLAKAWARERGANRVTPTA